MCLDCPGSCPAAPPLAPIPEEWKIFGVHGMVVVMSVAFIVGASIIIFMGIMNYISESRSYSTESG